MNLCVGLVRVSPREHDNEASVNVYEVLHVREFGYDEKYRIQYPDTVKCLKCAPEVCLVASTRLAGVRR